MKTKICTKCHTEQPLTEFHKDRTAADGHYPSCRTCSNKESAAHYAANRDRILESIRDYDRLHRQENRDRGHRYYALNKEMVSEKNRQHYLENKKAYYAKKSVQDAKLTGELEVQPCEECNETAGVEAHHDDYDKPLEVRWLCGSHHKRLHAKLNRSIQ